MGYHAKYTPEFKKRAVELYNSRGTTYAEVARELGVDDGTLSGWVKLANNDRPEDPEANPFQIAEENRRLRQENARLREEREILLKASAFFASMQL